MQPTCPDETPRGRGPSPTEPRADDELLATVGPVLCRVRVWTDEEWSQLAEAERPLAFERVPGLGWVGALPVVFLN